MVYLPRSFSQVSATSEPVYTLTYNWICEEDVGQALGVEV